jgi:hypothetical protein
MQDSLSGFQRCNSTCFASGVVLFEIQRQAEFRLWLHDLIYEFGKLWVFASGSQSLELSHLFT